MKEVQYEVVYYDPLNIPPELLHEMAIYKRWVKLNEFVSQSPAQRGNVHSTPE